MSKKLWNEAIQKWNEFKVKEPFIKAICLVCNKKTRYTAEPHNIKEHVCKYCFLTSYCAVRISKWNYLLLNLKFYFAKN